LIAASASEARTSIIASGGNFFSMCDYLQTLRLRANRRAPHPTKDSRQLPDVQDPKGPYLFQRRAYCEWGVPL